jgi:hypothetical protein
MRGVTTLLSALIVSCGLHAQPAPESAAATFKTVDLSTLAATVLSEASQARNRLAANDEPAALTHVRQALSAGSQIEGMPHPGLIPLSAEIETSSVYSPVKHGKSEGLTAKRLKKNTNVRDTRADISQSSLNIAAAQNSLQAAQSALQRDDFTAADTALVNVQEAVVHVSANQDVPLLRAHQNLELARARVLEDKYKGAAAPRRSAAQALDDFNRLVPGPHGTTATYMAQDMRAYAGRINRDRGDAMTNIEMWLDRVDKWDREMIR